MSRPRHTPQIATSPAFSVAASPCALPGAAAGSGFVPTDITGCVLWLDGSDDDVFTYSSGVIVSQWDDKSGEDNHATQGTAAYQPSRSATINGRSAVTFDATNDNMVGVLAETFTAQTVIWVGRLGASAGAYCRPFSQHPTGNAAGSDFNPTPAFIPLTRNNGVNSITTSSENTGTVTHKAGVAYGFDDTLIMLSNRYDGATISKAINNGTPSEDADTPVVTTTHYMMGTANYTGALTAASVLDGEVCEVAVYNRQITEDELSLWHSYSQSKWGTA